ncbi:GDSL-type esterase/lipase family protein [Cryobacterium sp. CG_9.6]|uniref:GDSL-type esterase/lipase family protein n=1 Tax=Cryobacterium sp. CG_9.6 TaxID=2760710 RepID=UPI002473E558|nr:GDSL-type esterase/lipase family protein [Cryobacterium sp. CG_9.6]MDH6236523.1 lysophospholipase L1-like esterase [Cryobacterium sp. CG_9.6]
MSLSISFVGDGLTAGGSWAEWFPEYDVTNLGLSGNTTTELVSGLDAMIASAPDVIVILAGTNDLGWRKSDEYVVRNLETILYRLRRALPATRILIQSVFPRHPDFALTIRSINRHIRQYAATQHALYLDLWPVLALANGEIDPQFSSDQLHLTDEGYQVWLDQLRPALEVLFAGSPTTSSIPIQHA